MIIVIVHWMIKPDPKSIEEFKLFWSKEAEPASRFGLIGEFLSAPMSPSEVGFPCGTFDDNDDSVHFFNVGLWRDKNAFVAAVIRPLVGKSVQKRDFEDRLRERMILSPEEWRIGEGLLPIQSHLL